MIHQLLNKKHSPKSISANFWEKAVFLFLRRLLIFTGFFLLPFIKEEVRYITPASFKTDGRRTVSPNGLFGLNLYRFEIMKDHDVDASEISSKQVTSYRLMALWPSHEIYPSKGKVHQLKGTVVEIPLLKPTGFMTGQMVGLGILSINSSEFVEFLLWLPFRCLMTLVAVMSTWMPCCVRAFDFFGAPSI